MNVFEQSKLSKQEQEVIITNLKKKFIKETYQKGLLWNSFKLKPKCFFPSKLKSFEKSIQGNIYFYLERENEIFVTNFDKVICFVENLEEWEEIDGYIFNSDMNWIIAITHEENKILCIGI